MLSAVLWGIFAYDQGLRGPALVSLNLDRWSSGKTSSLARKYSGLELPHDVVYHRQNGLAAIISLDNNINCNAVYNWKNVQSCGHVDPCFSAIITLALTLTDPLTRISACEEHARHCNIYFTNFDVDGWSHFTFRPETFTRTHKLTDTVELPTHATMLVTSVVI